MLTDILSESSPGSPVKGRPDAASRFRTAVGIDARREVVEFLDRQEGVVSLVLFLRMGDQLVADLERLPRGDWRRDGLIRRSAENRARVVREMLISIVGERSCWNQVTTFASLHACSVRGPARLMRRFVESDWLDSERSAVAGLVVDAKVKIPEYSIQARDEREAEKERRRVTGLLKNLPSTPNGYVNSLGIGNFDGPLGRFDGRGHTICVLDSGADESHPCLQQALKCHALFDAHGNYKEAKYAIDRGCHGTKVAGVMAGRTVNIQDLSLPGDRAIRMGLAPGSHLVSVNVLDGGCRKEACTLTGVLAGMNWACEHKNHPEFGGYEVVVMSMELGSYAFGPFVTERFDDALSVMIDGGLVPILAGGNSGAKSIPLGTLGTYVGAADSFGKPWKNNGRCDLLAPGVDLLCCQPPVEELGRDAVGMHSGTSLATAAAAAATVLLSQATGRGAAECLQALLSSSKSKKPWKRYRPRRRLRLARLGRLPTRCGSIPRPPEDGTAPVDGPDVPERGASRGGAVGIQG